MKTPKMTKLDFPAIISAASKLRSIGKLAVTGTNLTYLDIDDEYIHHLFPLLQKPNIKKPDYFGDGSVGAHISVIYPDENKIISKKDSGQEHHFKIKDLVMAEIGRKKYYVLLVESPSLLHLRSRCILPDMLCFKGYSIGFHITIAVSL